MRASALLKEALDSSQAMVLRLVEDMRDASLTFPTPNGGNHPLWILGHLAYSEGEFREWMLGEPNPVAHWKKLLDAGAEPVADAEAYPPFDELLAKFKELRGQNLQMLASMSDDDLDRRCAAPPKEFEKFLGTYGQVLLQAALHTMNHRGQLADARRAANRKPLLAGRVLDNLRRTSCHPERSEESPNDHGKKILRCAQDDMKAWIRI